MKKQTRDSASRLRGLWVRSLAAAPFMWLTALLILVRCSHVCCELEAPIVPTTSVYHRSVVLRRWHACQPLVHVQLSERLVPRLFPPRSTNKVLRYSQQPPLCRDAKCTPGPKEKGEHHLSAAQINKEMVDTAAYKPKLHCKQKVGDST